MRSMHSSEKIEEMVSELEGHRWDAILLSETWRHEQVEIWETHHKHIFMGFGKFDNKHGVGIMLNKKVEAENHRHRIHQRTCHHYHDPGKPSTHQTDECVLLPLGICQPSHRENVQDDREAHSKLQKIHTHYWRRLQCRIGTWTRNRMY